MPKQFVPLNLYSGSKTIDESGKVDEASGKQSRPFLVRIGYTCSYHLRRRKLSEDVGRARSDYLKVVLLPSPSLSFSSLSYNPANKKILLFCLRTHKSFVIFIADLQSS